jgi:hypothetical protein
MLRNLVLSLSLLCLLAICALTINCGGSSNSNTTSCTGGPYDVVGDWNLTFNGVAGSAGLINTSGLALFFDGDGDVVALPSITGSCSFSGTSTLYESLLGGAETVTGSTTGNVSSATSITATASSSSGTITLSAAPISPLSGAPTALSGSEWEGVIQADPFGNIWNLTFALTGTGQSMTLSGTSTNGEGTCTVSGTLTQEGSNNIFDSALAFSGSGCPFPSINGLALESNSDYFDVTGGAAGTYLYAISSTSPAVLEVFEQTGDDTSSVRRHDAMRTGSLGRRHFSF